MQCCAPAKSAPSPKSQEQIESSSSTEPDGNTGETQGLLVPPHKSNQVKDTNPHSGTNALSDCCGVREDGLKIVILVVFSLFVYALCYHAGDVVLPYLTRDIGVNEVQYGNLKSWIAILQVVGGVFLGRAGDEWGAIWILLLTQFMSGLSYVILASSTSELVIFLSFVPTLFQQGFQASVMIVANASSEEARITAIGRLSLFYGSGALIGPLMGGYLSQTLLDRGTLLLCGALSFLVAGLLLCFGFSENAPETQSMASAKREPTSILSLSELLRLTSYANVKQLLVLKFVQSCGRGLLDAMLSQFLMSDFNFQQKDTGLVLSYLEVIRMISSGVLVGIFCKYLGDESATAICLAVCAVSLAVLSFTASTTWLMIMLLLPFTASGMVATIIQGVQSKMVPSTDTGGIIGLDMATSSIAGIIAPLIGAWLNQAGGFSLVCAVSAGVSLLAFVFWYVFVLGISDRG